ncbi:MAG: DNA polymerase III subunit gamma/tau [Legionellales bacterium]|nr:DNA polymerase III subunit gamma/tau [Legionellales bacterium]
MTHQVLARKWRPRTFADVSGQKHVVRALSNALIQERLHHAYLLTGTRGVGKTSLARILAKCLNCEKGLTHEPCLVCSTCQAIEKNEFIDLIEIDAASRSRVEDTRDLLDNVQYMPTIGRYKVYLIDEVHMLSNHSFNALLKTLEEPPAHVVFILATTDPDRLPVTVLSRCLQFQLKAMTSEQIIQRLTTILQSENLAFTNAALATIADAAQGSMRDALSLLDQVIALGSGEVTEQASLDLLGGMSTQAVLALLQALANNEGKHTLEIIQRWLSEGFDFELALDAVINNLHQISVLQLIPDIAELDSCHSLRQSLAEQLTKEQVQLYYQIALYGKRDLPYAPTPRLGFEMTVLRMLAFFPAEKIEGNFKSATTPKPVAENLKPVIPDTTPALIAENLKSAAPDTTPAPIATNLKPAAPDTTPAPIAANLKPIVPADTSPTPLDWVTLLPQLGLQGATKVLAQYCHLKEYDGSTVTFELDPKQGPLLTSISQEKLTTAMSRYFEKTVCVRIEIGQSGLPCPANLAHQQNLATLNQAELSLSNDQSLQSLLKQLNADIEPGSILPKSREEKSQ